MGVILGSAVVPIALAITWSKANKNGCIWGSIAGFVAGVIAWLVTTSTLNNGVINVVVSSYPSFLVILAAHLDVLCLAD
jgi:urea-proton symporter